MPTGSPSFITDANQRVAEITPASQLKVSQVYDNLKPAYHESVTAASGGQQLADIPTGMLYLQSLSGNSPMYIGGLDTDAPFSGRGIILYSTDPIMQLPISNANRVSVVATVSGQLINYWGFLSGPNVLIDPSRQGTAPQVIPPNYVSSDPVSGATNVALNNAVLYAYFDQALNPATIHTSSFIVRFSGAAASTMVSGQALLSPTSSSIAQFQPFSGQFIATSWYNAYLTPMIMNTNAIVLAASGSFAFQTAAAPPPELPPVIVSSIPASGAASVSITADLSVTMDKLCSGASAVAPVILRLVDSSGTFISGSVAFDSAASRKVFTLNPGTSLIESKAYTLKVSGIYDLASNVMVPVSIPFTAADPPLTLLYSVTPTISTYTLDSSTDVVGEYRVNSSSVMNGKIIKQVKFWAKKNGSPTSALSVTIRHCILCDPETVVHTLGSIPAANITSSFQEFTVTDLANTHAITSTEAINLQIVASQMGTGSYTIQTGTNSFDGTNSIFVRYNDSIGTYDQVTSQDLAGAAYY